MKAVRKDYFLDHDHSAYVDQWDWERVITEDMRNLDFLKEVVEKIWTVIEVSVSVWPNILKEISKKKNIHVLD